MSSLPLASALGLLLCSSLAACGAKVSPETAGDAAGDAGGDAAVGDAGSDTSGDAGTDTTPPRSCGGTSTGVCVDGEYCSHPVGACLGDTTGTCEMRPKECGKDYRPMCGCDGVTYANPCLAAAAGMTLKHEGACDAPPPPSKSCGGFAGATCSPDEYCDFPDAYCGAADGSGVCQGRPSACDTTFDPVCGCDGKTYDNACVAHAAGSDDASKGPCSR